MEKSRWPRPWPATRFWQTGLASSLCIMGREASSGRGGRPVLLTLAAWRLHQDEIPRIALLTAAFFVASSMHVPLPGTSVHLILNGLVGVMLGWRAALALFVGLTLQAILIGHGGYFALGVNTCIMTVPALLAWGMFRLLHRVAWTTYPGIRAMFVIAATVAWLLGAVMAIVMLSEGVRWEYWTFEIVEEAMRVVVHPITLLAIAALAVLAAAIEHRMEHGPEFPLGLLIGVVTVLMTVALNCTVLIAGGAPFGTTPPLVLAVLHLPI